MTKEINAYMKRQAFGDYSKADDKTREEMENLALRYEAQQQARPSALVDLAAKQRVERYEDGTATAQDIIALRSSDAITVDEATRYYEAHGWTLPKFGIR